MAAFPELGYGFKTNKKTLPDIPASDEAMDWWRSLSDKEKSDWIIRKEPRCIYRSELNRMCLWNIYNKNPEPIYEIYTRIKDIL